MTCNCYTCKEIINDLLYEYNHISVLEFFYDKFNIDKQIFEILGKLFKTDNNLINDKLVTLDTTSDEEQGRETNGQGLLENKKYLCNKCINDYTDKLINTSNFDMFVKTHTHLIVMLKNKSHIYALNLIKYNIATKNNLNYIDIDYNTALQYCCSEPELIQCAIEIIKSGNSLPDHVNKNKDTALIIACDNKFSDLAIEIIKTGKSRPEMINIDDKTALMYACMHSLDDVAIKIIKTGRSRPDHIDKINKMTTLMYACRSGLENVALEIINTGNSKVEYIGINNYTALTYACLNCMSKVALAIVRTKKAAIDIVTESGNNILALCCVYGLPEVAIEIIKTYKQSSYKPDYVFKNYNDTILILACECRYSDVALEIIKTGNSNPGHIDKNNNTALLYACKNDLSDVAIEIIKTNKSKLNHVNDNNETAFLIACMQKLTNVIDYIIDNCNKYTNVLLSYLPNHIDNYGNNALVYLCSKNYQKYALKLIDTGNLNLNIINKQNNTNLIVACQENLPDVALKIINEITIENLKHIDSNGYSALMIAKFSKMEKVISKINDKLNNE